METEGTASALPEPSTLPVPSQGRLREIAALFTRLGFTAFGGPAAHTAMMEDEVVHRRKWIDRQTFLDLVAALNFIPGPNSTELAIHLGLIRGGLPGLLVAGFCFITPAVLIILPLAWLYVRYGGAGVTPPPVVGGILGGIAAVVVAVLAVAAIRFAGAAIKSRLTVLVAVLTIPGELLLRFPEHWLTWHPPSMTAVQSIQSEIVILAAAALVGAIGAGWRLRTSRHASASCLAIPLATLPALLPPATTVHEFVRLGGFFLTVGGTLFGSGYVLVNYLETGLVHGPDAWLTAQQLTDAVGVGQVTPGPLLTTATFIGYLRGHQVTAGSEWGGVGGAVIATVAIFLPAFVLVAVFGRFLMRLRRNVIAAAALDAMNAAVVSLLFLVTCRFVWNLQTPAGHPDLIRIAIAVVALAAMIRWRVNSTWLIAAGAAVGGVSN